MSNMHTAELNVHINKQDPVDLYMYIKMNYVSHVSQA